MLPNSEQLISQVERIILQWTNRRVWNLAVEVWPERVVLRGETNSFHAKQLAQEGVRQLLPSMALVNAITVAA